MNTTTDENVISALEMLTEFEKAKAEFYLEIASNCRQFPEFWESTSMAKMTCANLFSNLVEDSMANPEKYRLKRGIGKSFLRLVNKIKEQKERICTEKSMPGDKNRFVLEIEMASTKSGLLPIVLGETETFEKVTTILNQTQNRQMRLIQGFLKSVPPCSQ